MNDGTGIHQRIGPRSCAPESVIINNAVMVIDVVHIERHPADCLIYVVLPFCFGNLKKCLFHAKNALKWLSVDILSSIYRLCQRESIPPLKRPRAGQWDPRQRTQQQSHVIYRLLLNTH